MPSGGTDSDVFEIKQRLALIEARLDQLFTHLQVNPLKSPVDAGRSGDGGGGWWGDAKKAVDQQK